MASVLKLLLAFAVAISGAASAQAPVIRKPRPAPPGTGSMPPLPPARIDDLLAVGGDQIDARKVNTRMAVDVQINGRGPYRFVVDSGADTSVVGLNIARDLQLPVGEPAILNNMTSRNIVDRVKVDQLTLGPSTVRNLLLPALREHDLGGDGLIGIDALVHQRLMMDFEDRTIKVEDAAKPMRSAPGDIVVIAKRRRGQLILTEVKVAGLELEAVVDTGTEVTIGNLALRDRILSSKQKKKFYTVAATGVTGVTVDLQLAVIQELKLGSVTLRNVPIAFADLPPFEVFGLSREPALLLGTDMLETFRRVSLDFRARKVRFQLRRCGSAPITIHTSWSPGSSRLSAENEAVCRR